MKDNRFIELVNLYIDRQINAAEAADLEAEMQANPRRRAIYQQYCRMHRATTLVYESFRSDAPAQNGPAKSEATIARFDSQLLHRRNNRWAYYAGGLAAACLTLVFVRLNMNPAAEPALPIIGRHSIPTAPEAAVLASKPSGSSYVASDKRTTLVSLQASHFATEQDYAGMLAALRQEEQRAFANGLIQSTRLPALFDDGVFDAQSGFPAANQRVFRSKQAPAQQAEFTAFQFQR